MVEIYVSWSKGLPQSREALNILKASPHIVGVELSNIDEQFDMVKDSGLKVSAHTPGLALTLNLGDPDYMQAFEGETGTRLLEVIQTADARTVGFHLGYSAGKVYKMKAYPNVPTAETLLQNRQALKQRIISNVLALERRVNQDLPSDQQKQIVLESLDFSRAQDIPWDKQMDIAKANKDEIEATIAKYGINAGILHVTEPSFIKDVLDETGGKPIVPIGFLFDVAHTLISADTKMNTGHFTGDAFDYFNKVLDAVAGRTYQLHLTVPDGDENTGYSDHHNPFVREGVDTKTAYMIDLSRAVMQRSHNLEVITLEMATGLPPVDHAKEMVKQAEYAVQKLS